MSVYIADEEYEPLARAVREYARLRKWRPSRAIVEIVKEKLFAETDSEKKKWIKSLAGSCHFGMSHRAFQRFIRKSRSIEV